MGSQIRPHGQLLSAILFEVFTYIQCLRILKKYSSVIQYLINFRSDKSENLADEYFREYDPQAAASTQLFEKQNYQC